MGGRRWGGGGGGHYFRGDNCVLRGHNIPDLACNRKSVMLSLLEDILKTAIAN